jgi:hypothetical protein
MPLFLSSVALLAASVEPVIGEQQDLVRYALTQGGLLAVVLVLLWSYRRDNLSVLQEERDRNIVLTGLVSASTTAFVKAADAIDRNSRAVERCGGMGAVEELKDDLKQLLHQRPRQS